MYLLTLAILFTGIAIYAIYRTLSGGCTRFSYAPISGLRTSTIHMVVVSAFGDKPVDSVSNSDVV